MKCLISPAASYFILNRPQLFFPCSRFQILQYQTYFDNAGSKQVQKCPNCNFLKFFNSDFYRALVYQCILDNYCKGFVCLVHCMPYIKGFICLYHYLPCQLHLACFFLHLRVPDAAHLHLEAQQLVQITQVTNSFPPFPQDVKRNMVFLFQIHLYLIFFKRTF